MQHDFLLAPIRLTRMAAERGPILSGACGQMNGFQSLVCTSLPCASPRSEHGILGKRRVKLRSPAARRASRGCQPDEQIRPRLSGTLWSAAVRVRGSRAQRRGRGTSQLTLTARTHEGSERLNSLRHRGEGSGLAPTKWKTKAGSVWRSLQGSMELRIPRGTEPDGVAGEARIDAVALRGAADDGEAKPRAAAKQTLRPSRGSCGVCHAD